MSALRIILLVVSASIAGGCTAATLQAFAEGLEAGSRTRSGSGTAELLLFGGEGQKTFIGCLTCSKYDAGSVHNSYGDFGSKYASNSIFNPYSDFGSRYSDKSACNPYAANPPVIVDRDGGFYGRLTINRYHKDAVGASDIRAWLAAVCQR